MSASSRRLCYAACFFAWVGLAAATAEAGEGFVLHLGMEEPDTTVTYSFLPQQVAQADDEAGATASAGNDVAPFYKIGVGDALAISVWRFPDLSTSVIVRPDGFISVPLVEDLRVVGLTPTQASEAIQEQLAEFVQDPLVTVIVSRPVGTFDQQIRVIGEAAQPRALPWRRGLRLADVMISVGGLAPPADGNSAILLRRQGTTMKEMPLRLDDLIDRGDVTANLAMQPGDVIVIPEGFFHGDWTVNFAGNADITYTDNVDLDPNDKDEAIIIRAGPSIDVAANAARIEGALTANILFVQEFSDSQDLNLDGDLTATGTVELVDQTAFVDASASVARVLVSNRDSRSGSEANTGDEEFVQAYRVSPYLQSRFGSFASNELRYSGSVVLINNSDRANDDETSSGDGSDTITHDLSTTLDSGRDFSFFSWTLFGRVGRETSDDNDDVSRADINYSVQYPLWFERRLAVQGSIGYRVVDEDDDEDGEDDIDGVTWRTGLSWEPTPRFSATGGVGNDGENFVWDADIRYEPTPRLTLTASYVDETTTQQDRVVQNLPTTDQGVGDFNAQPNNFSIDDGVTRTRTFSGGATWQRRNIDASLAVSYSEQTEDETSSSGSDERSYDVTTSLDVGLSSDLTLVTSFSGTYREFDDTADDEDNEVELFPRIGLQYQVTGSFQTSLFYSYSQRIADNDEDDYKENAVTLSGSVAF